jgi:hypothetical protein
LASVFLKNFLCSKKSIILKNSLTVFPVMSTTDENQKLSHECHF